jgi:hypothetical protein
VRVHMAEVFAASLGFRISGATRACPPGASSRHLQQLLCVSKYSDSLGLFNGQRLREDRHRQLFAAVQADFVITRGTDLRNSARSRVHCVTAVPNHGPAEFVLAFEEHRIFPEIAATRRTTLRTHWGKSPYETQLGP